MDYTSKLIIEIPRGATKRDIQKVKSFLKIDLTVDKIIGVLNGNEIHPTVGGFSFKIYSDLAMRFFVKRGR